MPSQDIVIRVSGSTAATINKKAISLNRLAGSVARLNAAVATKMDLGPATAGMQNYGRAAADAAQRTDRFGTRVKGAGNALDNFGTLFLRMVRIMTAFFIITAVTTLVREFVEAVATAPAKMELWNVQLNTLVGNATVAAERLELLKDVAIDTPLELPDLFQGLVTLQAFNVEISERTLPLIADLAAVTDRSFQDVAAVIGKVIQGSKPAVTRSLPILGINPNDFKKLASELGNRSDAIFQIIDEKFGNFAKKSASTTIGILSNIKDAFFVVMADIGQAALPVVRGALQGILDAFQELRDQPERLRAIGVSMAVMARGAVQAAQGTARFLVRANEMVNILQALKVILQVVITLMAIKMVSAIGSMVLAMNPWTAALALGLGLIFAIANAQSQAEGQISRSIEANRLLSNSIAETNALRREAIGLINAHSVAAQSAELSALAEQARALANSPARSLSDQITDAEGFARTLAPLVEVIPELETLNGLVGELGTMVREQQPGAAQAPGALADVFREQASLLEVEAKRLDDIAAAALKAATEFKGIDLPLGDLEAEVDSTPAQRKLLNVLKAQFDSGLISREALVPQLQALITDVQDTAQELLANSTPADLEMGIKLSAKLTGEAGFLTSLDAVATAAKDELMTLQDQFAAGLIAPEAVAPQIQGLVEGLQIQTRQLIEDLRSTAQDLLQSSAPTEVELGVKLTAVHTNAERSLSAFDDVAAAAEDRLAALQSQLASGGLTREAVAPQIANIIGELRSQADSLLSEVASAADGLFSSPAELEMGIKLTAALTGEAGFLTSLDAVSAAAQQQLMTLQDQFAAGLIAPEAVAPQIQSLVSDLRSQAVALIESLQNEATTLIESSDPAEVQLGVNLTAVLTNAQGSLNAFDDMATAAGERLATLQSQFSAGVVTRDEVTPQIQALISGLRSQAETLINEATSTAEELLGGSKLAEVEMGIKLTAALTGEAGFLTSLEDVVSAAEGRLKLLQTEFASGLISEDAVGPQIQSLVGDLRGQAQTLVDSLQTEAQSLLDSSTPAEVEMGVKLTGVVTDAEGLLGSFDDVATAANERLTSLRTQLAAGIITKDEAAPQIESLITDLQAQATTLVEGIRGTAKGLLESSTPAEVELGVKLTAVLGDAEGFLASLDDVSTQAKDRLTLLQAQFTAGLITQDEVVPQVQALITDLQDTAKSLLESSTPTDVQMGIKLTAVLTNAEGFLKPFVKEVESETDKLLKRAFRRIANDLSNTFSELIGNAITPRDGQTAGQIMKGALAGVMDALGTALIEIGGAAQILQALLSNIFSPQGAALAIGAGIALKALAAAMRNDLANQAGGGGVGSAAGAGGASGPVTFPTFGQASSGDTFNVTIPTIDQKGVKEFVDGNFRVFSQGIVKRVRDEDTATGGSAHGVFLPSPQGAF